MVERSAEDSPVGEWLAALALLTSSLALALALFFTR